MAKSKNGGTRSFLRGRVGSDVYSIGKNAKGDKQQIVRALAETVANPQTTNQMRGRMIMSTVMQAVSGLSFIIDHSFDNVPKGQPSISEFISRNYALIKADVAAHPANGNKFGLNQYKEKGIKQGQYAVAAGSAVIPATIQDVASGTIRLVGLTSASTVADFKAAWGLTKDEYYTRVRISRDGKVTFCRVSFDFAVADTTVLTGDVLSAAMKLEGNGTFTPEVTEENVILSFSENSIDSAQTLIVSKLENGVYVHNDASFAVTADSAYTADVALPTYPVGTEQFLNGGDL